VKTVASLSEKQESLFQGKLLLIFWTGRNPSIQSFQSDKEFSEKVKIQSIKATDGK